jgi:beta-lactamase regulating signal transducer with metallopeptidase domain
MIATWMLYTLLVGGLLYGAARGAEFVCRAAGAPTRFAWAAALCLAVGLSANALRIATQRTQLRVTPSVPLTRTVAASPAGVPRVAPASAPSRWRSLVASLAPSTRALARALDPNELGDLTRLDRPLANAATATALTAIAYLLLALGRMRRLAAQLESRELDGHQVLVSDDLGPALVGIARPRVVVPWWMMSLAEHERRDILAHEREHARTSDPALAAGAALLVALAPWNVAGWGMLARLRLAIEADCDRRVLGSRVDARRYGALLLAVYERSMAGRVPRLAFVQRRSHLEERIRRLAGGRVPSLVSMRGAASMVAVVVLGGLACETTTPSKAARDAAAQRMTAPNSSPTIVGVEPPCLRSPSTLMFKDVNGVHRPRSMPEMIAAVRPHRPDVFGPREPKHLVLGLLLDENCTVRRDTVVDYPGDVSDGSLLSATFGDTTGFTPFRGTGFFPTPKYGGPLTGIFAIRPSEQWRERVARNACGFGIRFDEPCYMQGPLELRMMDSVRALIAVRRFRAPNEPADHVFLVTLAHPYAALTPLSIPHAVVGFQSGALYIEDFGARQPLWLFAPSTSTGLSSLKQKRDLTVFSNLVGVAHYDAGWLTLEQVRRLVPAKRCDGPKGACYELNGRRIEFPG